MKITNAVPTTPTEILTSPPNTQQHCVPENLAKKFRRSGGNGHRDGDGRGGGDGREAAACWLIAYGPSVCVMQRADGSTFRLDRSTFEREWSLEQPCSENSP